MRPLGLWSHEIRGAGRAALVAPVALAVLVVLLSALGTRLGSGPGNTARFLTTILEAGFPLAAGVAAASLIGADRAVELQLTLPRGYRRVLLRRLAVTVGWTAGCALAASASPAVTGRQDLLPVTSHGPAGWLFWLPPTLWLAALGLLAGAALRVPSAAVSIVAFAWLSGHVFAEPFGDSPVLRPLHLFATAYGTAPGEWAANRLALLGSALVLAAAAWPLLGDPERLLGGEKA